MKTVTYSEVVKFHGHSCPGLAMGYKMTTTAMEFLGVERPEDEELVAIVENDACGVDAVQYLSGCTFGKGNLIFKDYGKMVYTFFDRNSKKAVRISRRADRKPKTDDLNREEVVDLILNSNDLFDVKQVQLTEPDFASFYQTVICDDCGESVVEVRTQKYNNKILCIPCYAKRSKNG